MVRSGQFASIVRGNKFPPIVVPYIPAETNNIPIFPQAFTRCLDGQLPERVLLNDKYGNAWSAKTGKFENQICILEGWPEFVATNFAKPGDIFIFQYDGECTFHAKIFGLDGCEKEGVGGLIRSNAKEEETNADEHEYSTDEEMYEEEVVHHSSKKRKKMDPFCPDLFRSGRFARPNNAYFVTRIRKHRCNELHIPCETIKYFRLKLPKFISLRDSFGRKWRSERRMWTDGHQLYGGGWKYLCQANFITEEDLCICEFVKQRNEEDCIQVRFARSTGLS